MQTKDVAEMVLPVVSRPQDGSRIPLMRKVSSDPYFMGGGGEDLLCERCRTVLAKAVNRQRLPHAILLCPTCQHYVELNGSRR